MSDAPPPGHPFLALAILSLLPGDAVVRTGFGGHVEHALAYAMTALLITLVYSHVSVLQIFAGLTAWAACLEYLQRFSPGRTSQLIDFVFSALGVAIGVVLVVGRRKLTKPARRRT